jgi:hypothetical protein
MVITEGPILPTVHATTGLDPAQVSANNHTYIQISEKGGTEGPNSMSKNRDKNGGVNSISDTSQ